MQRAPTEMEQQVAIKMDYDSRELTDGLTLRIRRLTDFLNRFGESDRHSDDHHRAD